MSCKIGLLGDVMLGRGVADRLQSVNPEEVWAPELIEIASSLDLVVCNLECCISNRGRPTDLLPDKPFFFRAPRSAVGSLAAIGTAAVGLANNHALDFGADALSDTIDHLGAAKIAVAGAGADLDEARRGVVVERPGLRLGMVAVSDHPAAFAAGPGGWGIAHADLRDGVPDWLRVEIERLRAACDLLLVFPHWGPNMTVRPARWQRRVAAELLGAGADLVAGHSAHVFHGIEQTPAGLVAYDLGDALDDYAVHSRLRNDLGLLVVWEVKGGASQLELIGLRLDHCRTRLAAGDDAAWIARRIETACGQLGTVVERVDEQRFRVRP